MQNLFFVILRNMNITSLILCTILVPIISIIFYRILYTASKSKTIVKLWAIYRRVVLTYLILLVLMAVLTVFFASTDILRLAIVLITFISLGSWSFILGIKTLRQKKVSYLFKYRYINSIVFMLLPLSPLLLDYWTDPYFLAYSIIELVIYILLIISILVIFVITILTIRLSQKMKNKM